MGEKATGYEDYKQEPSGNILTRIAEAARLQLKLEQELSGLEKDVETKKEELRRVAETVLPDLMEEAQQEELKTADGIKVKVSERIQASIPKKDPARAVKCFKFIEDQGDERLIKRSFKIEFGREEEKWADKFERDLKQRKRPLNVVRDKTVHPSTLKAYIKEKLESGVDVPLDAFSVLRQRVTDIEVDTKE